MTYPKKVMSVAELQSFTGLSKYYLLCACRSKEGKGFALRASKGGKWMIDTTEFERWRKKNNGRDGFTFQAEA